MERTCDMVIRMAKYFCDNLCRHRSNGRTSQEELERLCDRCPICGFMDDILDSLNNADTDMADQVCGLVRKKLRIYYLSDIPDRIKNCKKILQDMEAGRIVSIWEDGFSTKDAVYRFIDCRHPEEYIGVSADQVIIDFRDPMRRISEEILAGSCAPEEYQVIDDRAIGAYG